MFTNIKVRCLKPNEGRHCCDFMQNGNDISTRFFQYNGTSSSSLLREVELVGPIQFR